MTAKKLIGKVHLWLGLSSGLLVFVVAITGCVLAFEQEIKTVLRPYQYIEPVANSVPLSPSQLRAIAEKVVPGKPAKAVIYGDGEHSTIVPFYGAAPDYYYQVYMNPYTGKVLHVHDEETDFFHFILHGHYYLWLPETIGQPVVAYGTLVFAIMLITGLVLWWPKNLKKANREKSFRIKWKAKWRRVNYDLHNVPGFYALSIGLVLALTGMIFGIQWFADSVYWVSSGGKTAPVYQLPLSDTTAVRRFTAPEDRIWQELVKSKPNTAGLYISFPEKASESIFAYVNYKPGTYYKMDYYSFDQHTLKPLITEGPYSGTYAKAGFSDKLRRMNYDIHTGAILSLPGKILAFCGSLICASLPITGTIIWWGRRKKKSPAAKQQASQRVREKV
ncbi:PepSY-associated TM helix domain-containing protein [Spirosoma sp.]|uniref:PepSY-associated TM helix domain-containing protein n=1 Tax=Spirosoma sp. TaxID=1899569 RepID=UPI002618316A|nr:PepSY-associated TM helix domain-containing protein [Spirosoma sp.]MCX6213354.1 PepSY-associated TM helix domain-containing protein [Spirosoma sp.]